MSSYRTKSTACKCGNSRKIGGRYCLSCHAMYMREWRKTHKLTPIQYKKMIARAYAGTYYRRGKIIKTKCFFCNCTDVQMHHPDYNKPLKIIWVCKEHHRKAESYNFSELNFAKVI